MLISPGSVARAPAPGVSRASAPPIWRNWSIVSVWPRPEPGPTVASSVVDRLGRQLVEQLRAAVNGSGSSGSMARSPSTTGGTVANVSRSGPSSRSGRRSARPRPRSPRNAAITIANERPRANAGTSGIGGKCSSDAQDISSSGSVGPQRVPRVQHLGGALEREEHRSGVELVDRVDGELDRGHDAEVAAAAAQRPEQVGVVLGVGAHERPVGGHELERGHGVRLQAVLAREPAHAAAERVAGDPDVRRGAVQPGEPVGREPRGDAVPLDARADPDALRAGVDADLLEPADVQQQRVLHVAERPLVVAGRLGRDAQPGAPGVVHGRGDVVGVGGERDRGRVLVAQQVERRAGLVPVADRRGVRRRR